MKFLLSALFLSFSLTFYAQWQSTNFSGIHEGVAAFDSNTFGIIEATGVKFTSNGGGNFSEGNLLDTDGIAISGFIPTDLEYFDENTLFCTGYFITNQFEGILKSVNGGVNWEYVHQATSIEPELQLNDLHVASNGDIYAVGKLGKVLKSVDEGETWTAQFVDGAGDLFQVFALDANQVSVGGVGGLFTSSNGGLIWDQEITSDPITGISYKDTNVIMACTADDEILFTTNGGLQWSTEAFDFVNLVDVTYFSDDTWFLGSSTEVYRSDDNGATWFIQPTQLSFVPLFQLKHRNGLLIGRRQNIVIFTTDPSDIPTDYLVLNEVEAPIGACGGVQSFNLIVDNLGSNEITDLLIELHINGELVSTHEWSGSLPSQSSGESVELEINTGISTGEEVYEFTIIEVNNEVNNYPIESSSETNYSSAGLEGTIQIGSNGDFEDLVAFHEAVGDFSLCGDVEILLSNGSYQGVQMNVEANGYRLSLLPANELSPEVTIYDGISFYGDNSFGSQLVIQNVHLTTDDLFINPGAFEGFEYIETLELSSTAPPAGYQIHFSFSTDSANVQTCVFNGGNHGIRLTGGEGQSLNIEDSNFEGCYGGIFVWLENDRVNVDRCVFNVTNRIMSVNVSNYIRFTNNICRATGNTAPMINAITPEEDGQGPRLLFYNNVVEHYHSQMLVAKGSARVLNNVFIRAGLGEESSSPVIIQNNTQADIKIQNNIFQMGTGLLGPMVSSNLLNQEPGMIDFNAYSTTSNWPFGLTNPGEYDTLEEYLENWQNIRQQDLNSIILEVDFEPNTFGKPILNANNSAILDASEFIGPEFDLAGNLRSVPNDLGAYEITIPGLDAELVTIVSDFDCAGNVTHFAQVSNTSSQTMTQVGISWSVDGEAQEQINWLGNIQPFDIVLIELGGSSIDSEEEMNIEAEITEVNNGQEEPEGNNYSSSIISAYSGVEVFHIGEDQAYETFDSVMLILSQEGMCGDQEIILHPGLYTSEIGEFVLSESQSNYLLTFTSSTGNEEDVVLDFSDEDFVLSGFKKLNFNHLSLSSTSSNQLTLNSAIDSLIIDHCVLGGKILIEEPSNTPAFPVVQIMNTSFTGLHMNGIEKTGLGGMQEFRFENNLLNQPMAFTNHLVKLNFAEEVYIINNRFDGLILNPIDLGECRHVTLSENTFDNHYLAAIIVSASEAGNSTLICQNNFSHPTATNGRFLNYNGAGVDQSTVIIEHNTARNCLLGLDIYDASSFVFNNILTATDRSIQFNESAAEMATLDGNIYSLTNLASAVGVGNTRYPLAVWQELYQQDLNSIFHVVEFDSDSGYQISDSMVDGIENGVAIAGVLASDIEGNPRDVDFPDVGCYEFGEIFTYTGIELIDISFEESCGANYQGELTVSNVGINTITSFEYTLSVEDMTFHGEWEGNLPSNSQTTFSFESFFPALSSEIEVSGHVISVNGDSENFGSTTLTNIPIEPQSLSGTVLVGASLNAQFNGLQEVFDYIQEIGICGDVEALVEPGEYSHLDVFKLGLEGFQVEFTGLDESPENTVVSGERALISFASDGFYFKNISFESTSLSNSLIQANTLSSFDNCIISCESSEASFDSHGSDIVLTNCTVDGSIEVSNFATAFIQGCTLNSGLRIETAPELTFTNNHVELTRFDNTEMEALIHLFQCRNVEISGNSIKTTMFSAIHTENCACPDISGLHLYNNLISSESSDICVHLEHASDIVLAHNTIKSANSSAFVTVYPVNISLINNIFRSEYSNPMSVGGPDESVIILNNIMSTDSDEEFSGMSNLELLNGVYSEIFTTGGNTGINPFLDAIGCYVTNEEALGLGIPYPDVPFDIYGETRSDENPTCGAIETGYSGDEPGDFNGDGIVGASDLLVLLSSIGCTGDCGPADIDGDGIVGIGDLLVLLGLI